MAFRLNMMETENVIKEVETRECLWNPYNIYYKNKATKERAWIDVCEAVSPIYNTCTNEEKKRIVRAVQARWKTARDAYMKCRMTNSKRPSCIAKSKRYVYYSRLTFLEKVKEYETDVYIHQTTSKNSNEVEVSNDFAGGSVSNQSGKPSDEDDDTNEGGDEIMDFDIDIHDDFKDKVKDFVTEEVAIEVGNDNVINGAIKKEYLPETSSQIKELNDPLQLEDTTVPPKKTKRITRPRKRKSKMSEFEIRLLNIMRLKNNRKPSVLSEDDQSFFNSLAPLIKNFDKYQKLMFRSKILDLVMEVENIHSVNVKQERETYIIEDLDESKQS